MNRITLLVCLLMAMACQGPAQSPADMVKKNLDDLTIAIPGVKNEPGLGENEGEPEGTELKLPPGIRIVQRPHHPFDPDIRKLYGIVNTFYADISFVIDKDVKTDTLHLPPGAIMVFNETGKTQHGIILGHITIDMDSLPKRLDTATIYVGLACLNEHWGLPWEENTQRTPDVRDYPIGKGMYRPGKVTTHKGLRMLAELLDQYPKLKLTHHYNPQLQFEEGYQAPEWNKIYATIQEMVWKVTDGPGIMKGELESYKEKLAPYK